MDAASALDLTKLLRDWTGGDRSALDRLLPIVYEELRRTAVAYMTRERAGHTLQATALINEAYLRVIDMNRIEWRDRTHFFALCAQMMRRILVDHARSRIYLKRGGGVRPVTLDESMVVGERTAELIALDDALKALALRDERKARVVELRFFAGLSVEETATVLKVSPQTVSRDWSLSKTWLAREMSREAHE
ncbi:MAG: sigma-70 family RNA polymerase sigma factor [Bryobacteraceae bacterium]